MRAIEIHLDLGLNFLKHISRTGHLLILLDPQNAERSIEDQLTVLLKELKTYDPSLLEKSIWLAVNKKDTRPFKVADNVTMMVVDPITGEKESFASKKTIIDSRTINYNIDYFLKEGILKGESLFKEKKDLSKFKEEELFLDLMKNPFIFIKRLKESDFPGHKELHKVYNNGDISDMYKFIKLSNI